MPKGRQYSRYVTQKGIKDVLITRCLYEDDEVCHRPVIVVETGLDRPSVDEVLDYLWQKDRIECLADDGGRR